MTLTCVCICVHAHMCVCVYVCISCGMRVCVCAKRTAGSRCEPAQNLFSLSHSLSSVYIYTFIHTHRRIGGGGFRKLAIVTVVERHQTRLHESCHTYGWVMSLMSQDKECIHMTHVMHESWHAAYPHINIYARTYIRTGWRRLIESPKLQIIFHKRATEYRSLLRKMTNQNKGSYESSPPCIISQNQYEIHTKVTFTNKSFLRKDMALFFWRCFSALPQK